MFNSTTRLCVVGFFVFTGSLEPQPLFNPLSFVIDELRCPQAQAGKPFLHT